MYYFKIFDSTIMNDVSYHLLSVSLTGIPFPGIIVKVNSDGNVLNAVWVIAPYDYYKEKLTSNTAVQCWVSKLIMLCIVFIIAIEY